ncbi:MAG: helix-turn-helix domain-containing protein, partial [Chloroflexota bacterium]|nr:helix-turn-helix domain-containing protein [Chloroflexota bacterium]
TMRERVGGHLLDLAEVDPITGVITAGVTQQQLADSVGSVREVVARVLRELRDEGIVTTSHGAITILNLSALAALVSRWRSIVRS